MNHNELIACVAARISGMSRENRQHLMRQTVKMAAESRDWKALAALVVSQWGEGDAMDLTKGPF